MKTIHSKILEGAPRSEVRYLAANTVCLHCIEAEKGKYQYSALCMNGIPMVAKGDCYVCEERGLTVAFVNVSKTVNFYCPKGYGECEDARGCVYPGRCQ